jgi:hypothetical protein
MDPALAAGSIYDLAIFKRRRRATTIAAATSKPPNADAEPRPGLTAQPRTDAVPSSVPPPQ